MSLSELHTAGGRPFMLFIDLLGISNLAIAGYLVFTIVKGRPMPDKLLEIFKHVGGFALAWGAFSTLVGLFFAFGALEEMTETLPFNIISGGLKVALITVLYGMVVYMLTLLAYIGFQLTRKTTA